MKSIFSTLGIVLTAAAAMAQPQIPQPGTREYREWEMRRQAQAQPEAWTVSGKIHSFNARAGEVNVMSEDGRPWRVKLNKEVPVQVKGEGGVEFLKPRTAVRFYAPITKRKMAVEPVMMVTTFTPRPPFEPSVEPTTEEEARSAMTEEKEGEENPVPADEFEAAPEEDRPALQERINREPQRSARGRASREEEPEEAEWFHITGILVSLKKGKFVVDAGEAGKIRGEISEDAKVDADLLGIQFASPGDSITAKGMTYPAQAMTAVATAVDVTLAAHQAESNERPRRGSRNRRGADSEQPPL